MPDRQMPIQGPASQRERDLDAVLSGEAGYPPVVLGPVAGVLAALRAAPAPDELDGEAAARAAFRMFVLPEVGGAGGTPVSAPIPRVPAQFHQVAAAGAGRPDGPGSTAVLPRTAPGGPRHARPRRPAPWHGRWPVMATVSGAAAAVIIGVAALAGAFAGPSARPGQSGVKPPSPSSSASSQRAAPSVLGTATARPTPRPSASSPEALCRQLTDDFMHPTPENRAAENALVQQLRKLAGGQLQIIGYCARQPGAGAAHGYNPGVHGGAGDFGAGNKPGGGGFGQQDRRGLAGRNRPLPSAGARFLSAGLFRAGRTAR